ncbi:MAG: alanine dehydrogenase, partial [Bdellovibrionales bacterium]|nr:alanine dehydrogenase [Bdellovibrionales bacterium]
MIIGVPKEIKNNENRVALVPGGVLALANRGHKVYVETKAGLGAGISDDDFIKAGAQILGTAQEIWNKAEMIIKVKEPIAPEYKLMKPGQILYTYLHLAAEPELTRALMEQKVSAVAYETIQLDNGSLPLLTPMSEVAGRMSVQVGAQYLEAPHGGRGILLGGIPGVAPANVVIIGGGVVGHNAAKIATGLGADVTLIDKNLNRLREIDDIFNGHVMTLASNSWTIGEAVRNADLVVGAVLVPGAAAPRLVKRDMIRRMKKGAVVVDVAIDQGGCFETSKATTHSNPTYVVDDVVHYCVSNMPAAVPHTSTF